MVAAPAPAKARHTAPAPGADGIGDRVFPQLGSAGLTDLVGRYPFGNYGVLPADTPLSTARAARAIAVERTLRKR